LKEITKKKEGYIYITIEPEDNIKEKIIKEIDESKRLGFKN
jgi:hypothetical protein